jgi:hypothetical protein
LLYRIRINRIGQPHALAGADGPHSIPVQVEFVPRGGHGRQVSARANEPETADVWIEAPYSREKLVAAVKQHVGSLPAKQPDEGSEVDIL